MLLQSQTEKELECVQFIIKDALKDKSEATATITDILHSYDNYICKKILRPTKFIS